jgi:enediyne biosynthesis protein E4
MTLLLLLVLAGTWWMARKVKNSPTRTTFPTNALQMLADFEEQAAMNFWKAELVAEERGRIVETLWDKINHSTNKLAELESGFSPGELKLPVFSGGRAAPHKIRIFEERQSQTVSATEWRDLLRKYQLEGWELAACEARFVEMSSAKTAVSPGIFYLSAHLTNNRTETRGILEGKVKISFGDSENTFRSVDASQLELRTRQGPAPFSEMFYAEVPPHEGSFFIDPLIVWDLNGDSQLEVILAAANVVFWREPNGRWTPDNLIETDLGLIFGGILGDFSGNGTTDFLAVKFEGAVLYEGAKDGRFSETPRPVWTAQPRLKYGQCFTAGDVDGDGDLDLFIGQYKLPYTHGQMPFPYFDANDGYPSFLLRNDGHGNFTDKTQTSGLSAKRGRRVYSSSLIDLDWDGDLDLVTISDFAGLDAFENDGTGKFNDATSKWFDETRGFGMAHSFADFNADGWLDLLMIGMNSPTADRLASAGLTRAYDRPDEAMRAAVTFGNRLFFGTKDGKFRQSRAGAQVARTGWSWGSAAGDLDNDGFPDVYIANGHATGELVHDYESEFWLHDIYVGNSQENWLADAYFRQKFAHRGSSGHSYGGYERNRLFLNEGGTNFIEGAHLFGVAMEQDSRNTALQDLDGDGKLDLIVTTFEAYPRSRQTIRFFRNNLFVSNRAARVRLTNDKRTGTAARLRGPGTNAFAIVSGESYRTQLPLESRIGVGAQEPEAVTFVGETNSFEILRANNR